MSDLCNSSMLAVLCPVYLRIYRISAIVGCMEKRTVTQVRTDLVGLLERVQRTGETILITNYRRPAAILSPVPKDMTDAETDQ